MKFCWKVSSRANYDYLQFYIDTTLKDQISGEVDWQQKSYSVSSGIHTLKWRYIKDGNDVSGDNCGWVDFVEWTGASPVPDSNNWAQLDFKHDVTGRRVEKKVDGFSTRYVYDGAHVIAEYDGNNNLLRKYMYGPGIDQPVCMIEVADSNATYYYHYDALGSVVALSDSSGDTVQTYEYSVFGEPAVEDANHTNPYMFAGRRYDAESGLYHNRARYYNPYTGRFLQTDPIGYGDGMNMYAYCGSNPLNFTDPSGNSEQIVTIPVETVWSDYSRGALDTPDQHKADVDAYLKASGFYKAAPGATLESVELDRDNLKYICTFEVPDDLSVTIKMGQENKRNILTVIDSQGNTEWLLDERLAGILANSYGKSIDEVWGENPDFDIKMLWEVVKGVAEQIDPVGSGAKGLLESVPWWVHAQRNNIATEAAEGDTNPDEWLILNNVNDPNFNRLGRIMDALPNE